MRASEDKKEASERQLTNANAAGSTSDRDDNADRDDGKRAHLSERVCVPTHKRAHARTSGARVVACSREIRVRLLRRARTPSSASILLVRAGEQPPLSPPTAPGNGLLRHPISGNHTSTRWRLRQGRPPEGATRAAMTQSQDFLFFFLRKDKRIITIKFRIEGNA